MADIDHLIHDARLNAGVSWALVVVVGLGIVLSLVAGSLLWAGLSATAVAVVLVPPAVARDRRLMLPWELVLLVAAPLLAGPVDVLPEVAGPFAVAALALAVALELDAFTPVEMTPGFAVVFVVTTTMALAGAWAIAQWLSDLLLGTSLLRDHDDLMWDLVVATATGILCGVLFAVYFRRIGVELLSSPEADS